jgi:MerR family transcriptional regulator, copper efflux regulator
MLNSRQREAQTSRRSLNIGEVAKASGIGIEALRFYERSGLLGRPGRTQSGYRFYDEEVLTRLDFIKRAQILGFSLQEIKQIIADKQAGRSPCQEVRRIVRHRLDELDEKMREMRRYRKELGAAFAKWEETGELDGHVCGLIEDTDIAHSNPAQRPFGSLAKRKKAKK